MLAVILALLIKLLLDPFIEEESPFLLFFGAVMVAAWFGGLGPGLLATALSTLASDYFFMVPVHSIQFEGSGQGLRLAMFALEGALISLLAETMHVARRYAEARTLQSQKDQEELRRSEERFRATFEGAAVGVAHVGLGGEWLRVNHKLCEIVGYTREELLELTFQDITHPDDLEEDFELAHSLMTGEETTGSIEKRYFRKDGSVVWIELSVSVARDEEGKPEYFISVIEDITERKRAEEALMQSEARHFAVVDTAFDAIVTMTGDGVIRSFNQGAERIFGYTAEEAIGEPLVLLMPDRFHEPHAAGLQRYLKTGEAHVIGKRMVELTGQRKDGREFPLELSIAEVRQGEDYLFTGIMRDITERKQAEEAQRFLIEAGALLSSSLDYRATLSSVTRLVVPYLADWCIVDVLEDDLLERVAVAHEDPQKVALAHELQERYPPDLDSPKGVPRVLRTGRSELAPEIPDTLLDEVAVDTEYREILRGLGLRSYMIVPLIARGRTLGAVTLVSAESGRRYGEAELEIAEELARRAALAVDNARLYKSRSEIARALQKGLLPARLPEVPGIEVGLRYLPAGAVDVGGDFYDVFDARINGEKDEPESWNVLIGDVCGKGAEAAAVLALARYTIRAVARYETRPSAVLAGLNEIMLNRRYERDDHKFCTITYLRLEPATKDEERGARITVSRGGHSVPILLTAGGEIQKIGHPGRAIGVFDDPNLTEQEAYLSPGDVLVLYTDGVLEARSPDGAFFGEERLISLLCSCNDLDASTIAGRVESAVLRFQENGPRDDIAVLVLRVPQLNG